MNDEYEIKVKEFSNYIKSLKEKNELSIKEQEELNNELDIWEKDNKNNLISDIK